MRITTIKYLADGTTVKWQSPKKGGGYEKDSIENGSDPRQAFKNYINDLKPFLIETAELGSLKDDQKKLIIPTGINISYKGENDVMHIGITGYRTFKKSGGSNPVIAAQKAITKATGKATSEENVLDPECATLAQNLIKEAEKYIKDRRPGIEKQTEMKATVTKPEKKSKTGKGAAGK